MNAKRSNGSRTHRFGGDWTTAKLDVIARYLESCTTALKDKPSADHRFVKGYIDAFAGTGYRDARRDERAEGGSQALLLPDLAEPEPQALLDGSAPRRRGWRTCLSNFPVAAAILESCGSFLSAAYGRAVQCP